MLCNHDGFYPRNSLLQLAVDKVEELEPKRVPETPDEGENDVDAMEEEENLDPDAGKTQQQVKDEMTGQLNLFES